ncbi:2502_t:CDS:2 [Funneliformis caledonium]|uniref:2502_t:CDS:1 n=1 Tax=Funneliformis caledonium TaxID=1117310 RepID=A0A9N8YU47_9GLOM|nr:2502_t:CDS:2 [Funneliformis caledonium]
MPVGVSFTQSFVGGMSNDNVFLFGGFRTNPLDNSLNLDDKLYSFNTETKAWFEPIVKGVGPIQRRQSQVSVDVNGKAYSFGGVIDEKTGSFGTTLLQDMNSFDTFNSEWSLNISLTDPALPFPRSDYTSTILSNGLIVLIGGWEQSTSDTGLFVYVSMKVLNLFDTNTATWSSTEAQGDVIDERRAHQAVLTRDENIIIYGGVKDYWTPSTPELAVLETRDGQYRWSVPQITARNRPPPLVYFTSSIFEDYMFVSFGNISNPVTSPLNTSSKIYLMDTRNFTWVDTFEVKASDVDPKTLTKTQTSIIIGLSTAGVGLIILISTVTCYLRQKRRKRFITNKGIDSHIVTPGTEHFTVQTARQISINLPNSPSTPRSLTRSPHSPSTPTSPYSSSVQYTPTNSGHFSQASSSIGGNRWENGYYPQAHFGGGQQYYQSYAESYPNYTPPSPLLPPNQPQQYLNSPIQPQIVQNVVLPGVIPQYGYIPQQVVYQYQDPPFPYQEYDNQTSRPETPSPLQYQGNDYPPPLHLNHNPSRSSPTPRSIPASNKNVTPPNTRVITPTITINRPTSLIDKIKKLGSDDGSGASKRSSFMERIRRIGNDDSSISSTSKRDTSNTFYTESSEASKRSSMMERLRSIGDEDSNGSTSKRYTSNTVNTVTTNATKTFKINIRKDKDIVELKNVIKEKKQLLFSTIDVNKLILWKVNIPTGDDQSIHKLSADATINIEDIGGELLPPLGEIQTLFPKQLAKDHIHVLVLSDDINELSKRCDLDPAFIPYYLRTNARILLEIIDNKMQVNEQAWLIQWNRPFPRDGPNQTMEYLISHITDPQWNGVNVNGWSTVFTFRNGRQLSECERALPDWTRRQIEKTDIGMSFRVSKVSDNGKIVIEYLDHAFNR